MTTEKINEMLNNNGCQVEGVRDGYVQSIDQDQIALDGVCVYNAYILNGGVHVSREEMQSAVDQW